MDDTLLANISDEQIDDTLNDESEEQIAKLNKAMKSLMQTNGPSLPYFIWKTSLSAKLLSYWE